jgi:hypothetical protein
MQGLSKGSRVMQSIQTIEQLLDGLSKRRRLNRGLRSAGVGLLCGSLTALLAVIGYKLAPLPASIISWAILVGLVATVGGFLVGFWKRPSMLETARWVDELKCLQERISTAWEYRGLPQSNEWQTLVVNDAVRVLGTIEPRRLLPLRFPREARWGISLALIAAVLNFVPEYRSEAALKSEQEARSLVDAGRQLADLSKQQLEQRQPVLQPTEKALNEVMEFGEKLQQVSATRNEALRDLATLQEKLERQFQNLAEKPALRTLEKAARAPSSGAGPTDLQKRMDALKQALGKAAGQEEAVDQLKSGLEKLKQSAQALPAGDSAEAKAAREKLADSLSDLAQQAKESGIPMASLDEAIDALRNAQTDFFVRDLNTALQELEKLQELGKNLQQLQQEMAKVAKDLAEQLQLGQAKAAQSTLEKMIQQLRSGSLTAEQLQKLLEEVQSASTPAKEYGEVAEHLQRAAEKMAQCKQSGDRPELRQGAAADLAKAAEELDKLLQQSADAEQLAAAMESLSRAQMSLSTGKQFGQCRGTRPVFGKGGKPGKGVGTWADEEGWAQIPEQTQGWDNSGIQQPELDSKGLTDRGEAEHNPALTPTKVRGQMSPGGSMQSITLKGVHIKGQSQVKFTETAAAAQAAAQNALNQDQVPKAYQQSVRDYFDDLKP